MRKCIVAIFLILCIPLIVYSQDTSSINNPKTITFDGCEFIVQFPSNTKNKISYIGDYENVMVQSVYDGESPFMRAECFPINDRNKAISNLKYNLEKHAEMMGIKTPEITIEDSEFGKIGTYSGTKKSGGFDTKVYGKVFLGQYSTLSLLVGEELAKFPSDKTVFFLNAVSRR